MQWNSKHGKSRNRYSRYKTAKPLGGMRDHGATNGDIRFDHEHGYIKTYAHRNADGVLVRNDPLTVNVAIASGAGARRQVRRQEEVARELRDGNFAIPSSVFPGGVLDKYKAIDFSTPKTVSAAKQHVLWPMFEAAIEIEMNRMRDKGVMVAVDKKDIPHRLRRSLIRTKTVLALKSGPNEGVTKAKARLVACGYSQVDSATTTRPTRRPAPR